MFYCIFNQINAALVSIRDLINKKKSYQPQILNSTVWIYVNIFQKYYFTLKINKWLENKKANGSERREGE